MAFEGKTELAKQQHAHELPQVKEQHSYSREKGYESKEGGYEFQEYPKSLYHAAGIEKVVANADEEQEARAEGFKSLSEK